MNAPDLPSVLIEACLNGWIISTISHDPYKQTVRVYPTIELAMEYIKHWLESN